MSSAMMEWQVALMTASEISNWYRAEMGRIAS